MMGPPMRSLPGSLRKSHGSRRRADGQEHGQEHGAVRGCVEKDAGKDVR